MKTKALIAALELMDRHGAWAFSPQQLRLFFVQESPGSFAKSLCLHAAEGTLLRSVARGVYVNPRARSMPGPTLKALVPYLRPWATNYVSLESVLGGTEHLSQMPGRLTVVSTGRSAVVETCYGDIEFVRTRVPREEVRAGLILDPDSGLLHATPERALVDFRRFERSHDLLIA